MSLYYDLNVFKDVYKLILIIFEITKEFPREYKYTLGQDIHPVKYDLSNIQGERLHQQKTGVH